jgi:acyl-CoA thioester hydrolase
MDFRAEVTRDQEFVDIVMRTTAIGRSSLTIAHEIRLPDGSLAAEGQTVVVAWDRDRRCSRAISDDERKTLFNETRGSHVSLSDH